MLSNRLLTSCRDIEYLRGSLLDLGYHIPEMKYTFEPGQLKQTNHAGAGRGQESDLPLRKAGGAMTTRGCAADTLCRTELTS